jgi:diguanylate cyclase (GGDEF)-like protein
MNRFTDGETGERGYLITGRGDYLEPYNTFTSTIEHLYADLVASTVNNPVHRQQVALLQPLLIARKNELQSMIDLRRSSGLDAARTSASFDLGKSLQDQIRAIVSTMKANEALTISQRNADVAVATEQLQAAVAWVVLTITILATAAITVAWRSKRRIAAAQQAIVVADTDKQRLLRRMAQVDALTGLANRRHFDETLSSEWRRCTRSGNPLSLALIDLDHFKLFNDHYGHQAGASCLQQVSACLKAGLARSHDLVARYGGEEFACVMPETSLKGAEAKARALQKAVRALRIPHENPPWRAASSPSALALQ